MKRTFCTLLVVLFASTAFGFGQKYGSHQSGKNTVEDQMPAGYNKTARINVEGDWDFFLTGSFILWRASEDGCEVAYKGNTYPAEGKLINMDFDFKPGFKVGLGMHFNYDNWNLYAEYTRLNMTDKRSVSQFAGTALTSPWIKDTLLGSCAAASAKWKLDYNMFHLELGRPYYVGCELSFKPHIGFISGWIDQRYDVDYTASYSPHSDNSNNAWLLGMRAGVYTNWELGCGVRMFGNLASALFYEHFNTSTHQNSTIEAVTNKRHVTSKVGHTAPSLEMGIGFGWGTYFAQNKWHFDVTGGWDYLIFWNQNYMRPLIHTVSDAQGEGSAGDLAMQGLTLTFRFDF